MPKISELAKIGEGREAEMFAWEGGTVLRLLRNSRARQQVQWEAAAMQAARDRGAPVPAVYEVLELEGRPGLVMERVDGTDLLTLVAKRPWTVFRVARICGEVHARLHAARASGRMPPLKARIEMKLQGSDAVPSEVAEFARPRLEALPDGDAICHGDFHPANILLDGDRPVLIDWTNATKGPAEADVARTKLIFRLGEPPPNSGALLKVLTMVGRQIMSAGYMRAYRRNRAMDMNLVERWEVVQAAERLADGIPEERSKLLRLLAEERRRSD
jgi:Ser/Thr protein kinase RdoA (MazF antagonist)